jgi:hypothetical protein
VIRVCSPPRRLIPWSLNRAHDIGGFKYGVHRLPPGIVVGSGATTFLYLEWDVRIVTNYWRMSQSVKPTVSVRVMDTDVICSPPPRNRVPPHETRFPSCHSRKDRIGIYIRSLVIPVDEVH